MFKQIRASTLAVAALMGMSAMAPTMAMNRPVMSIPATKPGKRGLFNDMVLPEGASRYGRKGAGISMAQQQRASQKKRNRARHRAHCK
jgi:hypothetical protein